MLIVQCVNKDYLDPYLVSRQSQIESGVPFKHMLFSYDDLPMEHIKLPMTEHNNNTPFTDTEFRGMVLRLHAFDWLMKNGYKDERILYIDCDTLVQESLEELEQVDIGDNWLGAARENHCKYYKADLVYKDKYPEEEERRESLQPDYFNSGVLLIDLNKVDFTFADKFDPIGKGYIYPDQDYLNEITEHYATMPRGYNCLPEMRVSDLLEVDHLMDIHREMLRAPIAHYAGRIKPYTPFFVHFYGVQLPFYKYYEVAKRTEGVSEEFLSIIKDNVDKYESLTKIMEPFL